MQEDTIINQRLTMCEIPFRYGTNVNTIYIERCNSISDWLGIAKDRVVLSIHSPLMIGNGQWVAENSKAKHDGRCCENRTGD